MNSPAALCQLSGLIRNLQPQVPEDERATLDRLTRSAAESVPGARYAGITIRARRTLETPSATGQYPIILDQIQNRHREGPGLPGAMASHTIRVDDLAAEDRWPRYRQEALRRTPIRSILSFRLFADKQTAGSLNLYADEIHAFGPGSLELGRAFATQVALAWTIFQRDRQFRAALASRDLIGQAKGVIMERFGIDAVAAFELLKRLSQQSNTPIAEIAERLISSGSQACKVAAG